MPAGVGSVAQCQGSRGCWGRLKLYELQSKLLQGGYVRDFIGDYYRYFKGDTRCLDHGLYE